MGKKLRIKNFPITAQSISSVDGHAHTMSRCVFIYRSDPVQGRMSWEEFVASSKGKQLETIGMNLHTMGLFARYRGVEQQAITEHPMLFTEEAKVSYQDYAQLFDEVSRIVSRNARTRLLRGLELNVTVADDNTISLGESTHLPDSGTIGDILGEQEVIIASIHNKYLGGMESILTSEEYFSLLCSAVQTLAKIVERISPRPVLVLGHPFSAAAEKNLEIFQPSRQGEARYKIAKPRRGFWEYQHGMRERKPPLQFFTARRLEQLAKLLCDAGVYPELNFFYTQTGYCETQLHVKQVFPSVIDSYIKYCMKKGRVPVISLGTDDHNCALIGRQLEHVHFSDLTHAIPSLPYAHMWKIQD